MRRLFVEASDVLGAGSRNSPVNRAGHTAGLQLGEFGFFARVVLVNIRSPKCEPAFKVFGTEQRLCAQIQMALKRVAPVQPRTKENRFPEIAHNGQVPLKIEPCHLNKDRPEKVIGEDFPVELADQCIDVFAVTNVSQNIFHTPILQLVE